MHFSGKDQSKRTDAHGSNDEQFNSAFKDTLRLKPPTKTPVAVPTKPNHTRSIISSNINTFDTFRRNQEDSDDDDDDQGNGRRLFRMK